MSFIKFTTKRDAASHLDRIAPCATAEQLGHAARVFWLGCGVGLFNTDDEADSERLRKLETVALRAAGIID
jgi:hypothetical protein